jgi:hypothetical protein
MRARLRCLLLHIYWYAGVQHAVGQALIAQEAGAPRQPRSIAQTGDEAGTKQTSSLPYTA